MKFLKKKPRTLTGNSPEFDGTIYAGTSFEVDLGVILPKDRRAIDDKHTFAVKGNTRQLSDLVGRDLLALAVSGWRNIENEDGSPLPADESGMDYMWENHTGWAWIVIAAASSAGVDDSVKEAELKNSATAGSGS